MRRSPEKTGGSDLDRTLELGEPVADIAPADIAPADIAPATLFREGDELGEMQELGKVAVIAGTGFCGTADTVGSQGWHLAQGRPVSKRLRRWLPMTSRISSSGTASAMARIGDPSVSSGVHQAGSGSNRVTNLRRR